MPRRVPSQIFMVPAAGALLSSERDATDLIGDALGADAGVIAIPASRLDPATFDLSTRLLGAFLQKFVTYGMTVVILGDIADRTVASRALADFVRESNAGGHVWFLDDLKALTARPARR